MGRETLEMSRLVVIRGSTRMDVFRVFIEMDRSSPPGEKFQWRKKTLIHFNKHPENNACAGSSLQRDYATMNWSGQCSGRNLTHCSLCSREAITVMPYTKPSHTYYQHPHLLTTCQCGILGKPNVGEA
ncbi:hypothetical protein FKM82_011797 [Ascaphus truei]